MTVIVWLAEPPPLPNATGDCCCKPRVTIRPPLSLVVVRYTFTDSPAASAADATRTVVETSAAAATHPIFLGMDMGGDSFAGGGGPRPEKVKAVNCNHIHRCRVNRL
ncbi:hypothetical protein Abr02nite_40100 [Paractinoplanes brasiliensis]|nr:hypothetical protein Abr02nite_40100 [Actinoplanes brasiliensis]